MIFNQYHFHIYFEPKDSLKARKLVEELQQIEHLGIGRIWDRPIGPHPIGSCQITVSSDHYHEMTEWFLKNRNHLTIFIHPVTGDDLVDHTDHVMWIGKPYDINVDFFKGKN